MRLINTILVAAIYLTIIVCIEGCSPEKSISPSVSYTAAQYRMSVLFSQTLDLDNIQTKEIAEKLELARTVDQRLEDIPIGNFGFRLDSLIVGMNNSLLEHVEIDSSTGYIINYGILSLDEINRNYPARIREVIVFPLAQQWLIEFDSWLNPIVAASMFRSVPGVGADPIKISPRDVVNPYPRIDFSLEENHDSNIYHFWFYDKRSNNGLNPLIWHVKVTGNQPELVPNS